MLFTLPATPAGTPFTTPLEPATSLTIAAGQVEYYSGDAPMIQISETSVDLTNNGLIWSQDGPAIDAFNIGTFTNTGTVVAVSSVNQEIACEFESTIEGFANSGSIYAWSTAGAADGIIDYSPIAATNSGLIAAYSATGVATGWDRENGGETINAATGQILAEGNSAIGITLDRFTFAREYPAAFTNYGTITAISTGSEASIGLAFSTEEFNNFIQTIDNYGTITADVAIDADDFGMSPVQMGTEAINNFAGGTINGEVLLGLGNDTLTNDGTINGVVVLGEGNDVVDDRLGTINGYTVLGDGTDTYYGGAGNDDVEAGRGNDTIYAGTGNALLIAGAGNDVLVGGGGNDGLYGSFGTVTIYTSGGDYVEGGTGTATVILGDLTFAYVDGGTGPSTLVLPGSVAFLDLNAALQTGRIGHFGTIELAAGQRLSISAGDATELAGSGQALHITSQGSGEVDLVGTWTQDGTSTQDGTVYDAFTSGSDTVDIAQGLAWEDVATVNPLATSLSGVAGGPAAPRVTGQPGAQLPSDNTEVTDYVFLTLTIDAAETWHSTSGYAVLEGGDDGTPAYLTNYGTIISDATAANGAASSIAVAGNPTLVNYGTITSTFTGNATIVAADAQALSVYGLGIELGHAENITLNSVAGMNLTNYGTIDAVSSSAAALAAFYTGFVNYGTISATSDDYIATADFLSQTDNASDGYFTVSNPEVVNAGTISAKGGTYAIGIFVSTYGNVIDNSGTITATTGAGGQSDGVLYYYLTGQATLINSGTITATTAIGMLINPNQGQLLVLNSGTINGAITLNTQPLPTDPIDASPDDVIINTGRINGQVSLGSADDIYFGRSGTETGGVIAGSGNDILVGGSGDTLAGGSGNDTIVAGGGGEALGAGTGTDRFVFVSATDSTAADPDKINNFVSGKDVIDLSALGLAAVTITSSGGVSTIRGTGTGAGFVLLVNGNVAQSDIVLAAPTADQTAGSGNSVLVAPAGGGTLTGGAGNDVLIGGSGDDVLDGGAGNNILYGGGGVNTAVFQGYSSDFSITVNADGSRTVTNLYSISATDQPAPEGTSILYGIQILRFDDVTIRLPTGLDFNGDGIGDVLFRSATGTFATWQLSRSGSIGGGGSIGNPGASYSLVGAGDFTGGGTTDLLFQSTSGAIADWLVNGTAISGGTTLGDPGISWKVVGTGYFTGGTTAGVLFYNTGSGAYATWDITSNAISGGGTLGTPGPQWVEKAVGDFNGDGNSDILFENANGSYAIWELNDTAIIAAGTIGNPGAGWFFKGVGDFTGNGMTDVLFENSAGTYMTWDMDGTQITGGGVIGNPGADWTLAGIGDYNGDGTSDLLFENANGTLETWDIDGATVLSTTTVGNPGSGYAVAATSAPQNFADLVFQNSATSAVATWEIGDGTIVGGGTLGTPGAAWMAIATGDFAGTGETDVLFENTNGTYATWASNGSTLVGGTTLGNPGSAWTFEGTGDFNGDGKTDLLFENTTTGIYASWDIADGQIIGGGNIGVAAGYTYVATADLTGNGKSDIIFEDSKGDYAAWLINDTTITGGGTIGNPGAGWTFKGVGDFTGNGHDDLLFENASGMYASWDMNGTQIVGGGNIGNPGGTWQLAAITDLNNSGTSDLVFENAQGTFAAWYLNDTTITGGATLGALPSGWKLA